MSCGYLAFPALLGLSFPTCKHNQMVLGISRSPVHRLQVFCPILKSSSCLGPNEWDTRCHVTIMRDVPWFEMGVSKPTACKVMSSYPTTA